MRASLEQTLDLIRRLNTTANNYKIGYDINPRTQACAYWLEIENFPALKSENRNRLCKLLDTFTINQESLRNMNVAVNCDFVLTHMLLSRLDQDAA